ncbi:MAG: hypothetical protein V4440_14800 [Pseudomonadota bacterium]
MINVLIYTLCASGTLLTLLGAYVFIKVLIMPNSPPADRTNRINHLRVVFFALQSPEKFIEMYPWLSRDEIENLK